MREPLLRQGRSDERSPFERLKRDLETVDCDTGVLWRSEIRTLPEILMPGERMELIVPSRVGGDPTLAVVTDRRLILVSDERLEAVPHGTTTELAVTQDWADDFKLRFMRPEGELVVEDVDEDDAPRLYDRLRSAGRVPRAMGKEKVLRELEESPHGRSVFPSSTALPDPMPGLRQLHRRWVLRA